MSSLSGDTTWLHNAGAALIASLYNREYIIRGVFGYCSLDNRNYHNYQ